MRNPAPHLTLVATLLVVPACASSGPEAVSGRRTTDLRVEDQRSMTSSSTTIYTEGRTTVFVLEHPPERVWPALEEVWQALDLSATEYDPRQRLIGNEAMPAVRIAGERMAHWVDCGSGMTGPNANRFDVVIMLYTTLRAHEQGTELVVDMDGQGKPRDYSGNWMHCGSTGRLEAVIHELVSARLGG